VALTFWVLTACWVLNIFPDIHAVSKVSEAKSFARLLTHWTSDVIQQKLSAVGGDNKLWSPQLSRGAMVAPAVHTTELVRQFEQLTPDWPAVTAGGCRYFHTARAWLVDRLPVLMKFDFMFWLTIQPEMLPLIQLGRTVPPEPSPTQSTVMLGLGPNPEVTDILNMPANLITKTIFFTHVSATRLKRAVLLEFAMVNPEEAARLLLRLEDEIRFSVDLFCNKSKVQDMVGELRYVLQMHDAMPLRKASWFDSVRGVNQATAQAQVEEQKALELIADTQQQKVQQMKAKYQADETALLEAPKNLSKCSNRQRSQKSNSKKRYQYLKKRRKNRSKGSHLQQDANRERPADDTQTLSSLGSHSIESNAPKLPDSQTNEQQLLEKTTQNPTPPLALPSQPGPSHHTPQPVAQPPQPGPARHTPQVLAQYTSTWVRQYTTAFASTTSESESSGAKKHK
jgi:hypothetical protein